MTEETEWSLFVSEFPPHAGHSEYSLPCRGEGRVRRFAGSHLVLRDIFLGIAEGAMRRRNVLREQASR